MKKLALAAALALAALGSAQAATATGNFNVVINLTGSCQINTTLADLTMSYTAFQTTDAMGSTNFNVRCTNGLPYTIGLSGAGATAASATDDVVNLAYTLNLSSVATHAPGTNVSLTGLTGSGANQTYYVHGTIAAAQGGTCTLGTGCSNAAATNRAKTITITY